MHLLQTNKIHHQSASFKIKMAQINKLAVCSRRQTIATCMSAKATSHNYQEDKLIRKTQRYRQTLRK
jgi:hypothetical protein